MILSHNQMCYNLNVGQNQLGYMLSKFVVIIRNSQNDDRQLGIVAAESREEAAQSVLDSNPGWEIELVKFNRGGARPGAGRVSKWGDNVETHRYRLPRSFGDNAEKIIDSLEMINAVVESWESRVTQSAASTASGQPAERYKYVAQMCAELRRELSSLPQSWD